MKDKILDGKKLADLLNVELREKINTSVEKTGVIPKLVTIIVGNNPSSKVYVNIKQKTCEKVGIKSIIRELNENIPLNQLIGEIIKYNNDPSIHGILLQMPLPENLRAKTSEIVDYITPSKDVDGSNSATKGKLFNYEEELAPCTPKGIIELLEFYKVDLRGKEVVIINRSNLVGKPLIFMLLKRNATVSICHTSTKDIEKHIKNADILIVGVGKPMFITKDMIKEGVIIVDVGINRVDGKLCGDVDFEGVIDKCSKITPSPGGVGPLTVAFLMQNTYLAYKKQLKLY